MLRAVVSDIRSRLGLGPGRKQRAAQPAVRQSQPPVQAEPRRPGSRHSPDRHAKVRTVTSRTWLPCSDDRSGSRRGRSARARGCRWPLHRPGGCSADHQDTSGTYGQASGQHAAHDAAGSRQHRAQPGRRVAFSGSLLGPGAQAARAGRAGLRHADEIVAETEREPHRRRRTRRRRPPATATTTTGPEPTTTTSPRRRHHRPVPADPRSRRPTLDAGQRRHGARLRRLRPPPSRRPAKSAAPTSRTGADPLRPPPVRVPAPRTRPPRPPSPARRVRPARRNGRGRAMRTRSSSAAQSRSPRPREGRGEAQSARETPRPLARQRQPNATANVDAQHPAQASAT